MTGRSKSVPYVFGVDVEDLRDRIPGGGLYESRVPAMTQLYLDFLSRHGAKGTFFVVGDVARAQPALVAHIVAEGHEIGCHSDRHVDLKTQDASQFRDDLRRNLDALHAAGAKTVTGYRAPCFSLNEATSWVYSILAELGFTYSSSVLPARNPIGGWPAFGDRPRLMEGVVELPVTLLPHRLLPVPMGGGVYFRALPMPILRSAFRRRFRSREPVLGYLHPYDLDEGQEYRHPGFARWNPAQWLLSFNRGAVMDRLETVAGLGFSIVGYARHAVAVREALAEGDGR